ncbi:MAG: hypothetical protein IM333_12820 [Microcystis sp. M048S1]|uniref:hypothetical protein n=1 Tax=unclassified Microcystis TaxID=2643300 RepID=UPI001192D01E|nr:MULTISPECIES: hypothetical protein [unclassified Microcystis]MCA2903429.1 hypothetical protein [Microcystis sp. M035S1]MCA2723442.1 hypothetical protein [Microcystis sp. M176S2]MCA2726535.1 hypothetical protein [Microcystis sp. M166S2]MCA2730008.1 hypothetical protein [Microcystis sp. M162S2]MCA2748690.1 hypothetical protein [Microcystis sp. M155S2]
MSSFEDLRKMQARQKQEEARKLEERKRAEAERRENQYRYNQAMESAERARQSFSMTQEAQNNRIWHHFSSLIPEILDDFGQLIYGNSIEKKVEYTRGFLGLGSSEIVREISHKNYQVKGSYTEFILSARYLNSPGYSVKLLTQNKQFTQQYLRLENGIEKSAQYSDRADFIIEFCKICYFWTTSERRCSVPWEDALCERSSDNYYVTDVYDTIVHEDHVKDMVKLQRSDIEKALTEIWQARENKD